MKILCLVLFTLSLTSCGIIKGHRNETIDNIIKTSEEFYPDDNFVEQKIEDILEGLTGLETDFSPLSQEG